MGPESSTSLAPGFRFHPTDVELVGYYLRRKVSGKAFRVDAISDVDVYKSEPWDLPGKSRLKTRDLEWYFFSALDRKHNNGSKTNRATEMGYWKTTGKDRAVRRGGRIVGMKKTLVYHKGRAPRGERTNWVMHEYKLVEEELKKIGVTQDAFVVCRIFQKSGPGAKNGEQYGAPLVDEEWDDEEELALPPDQTAEAVAPVAQLAPTEDSYVEASDLDEELKDVLFENVPLPLEFYCGDNSNNAENLLQIPGNPLIGSDGNQLGLEALDDQFYCDDSSNNAENYNHLMQNDENTVIVTDGNHLGIQGQDDQKLFYFPALDDDTSALVKNEYYVDFEQYNGDDLILDEPYVDASDNQLEIDSKSVKDDYFVEQSSISNPVDASYFSETYLDASENPSSFDHRFVKTDDLINAVEGENSGIDMMEEYLKYLDAEGGSTSQFMPFDPSNIVGAENPISDQAFHIQKEDVHVQSQQGLMESHQLETENIDGASSSKQNPEAGEHDTDIPYSFIKQASCKQAFASELSPKNALLRIHSGAQSSSPIHITAGMIQIQDVTERGGLRMNWSYGKDGNLNLVFSLVLPRGDPNTASMDPVASFLRSAKMASATSWAWFYNICFFALVLCVGYKLGTSISTR